MHAPNLFPGPKHHLSPGKPSNIFPKKNACFTKWHGRPGKEKRTKCIHLLQKCHWNGTWVKPLHSGNIHMDWFGISGILASLHVATLQRSLASLLRYMLLRCRDLWYPCFVTCCYAAEISGILASLHVATLQRSLVPLLRYMLLRCRDLWYPCFVTCCYAAEISGILASLHVATLQRSLVSLLRYMLLRCRDLWYPCFVTCCYAAEISGILASLHVATLQRSLPIPWWTRSILDGWKLIL